ncbi:MAG: hypothetical protein AVO35_10710 [Candidatus Aegiribacteria sp. MLS_C]|nr:MAG: hypothetical protein AVO35_10710 [Candidatus Aegiribacteria sp. MLS_C]
MRNPPRILLSPCYNPENQIGMAKLHADGVGRGQFHVLHLPGPGAGPRGAAVVVASAAGKKNGRGTEYHGQPFQIDLQLCPPSMSGPLF